MIIGLFIFMIFRVLFFRIILELIFEFIVSDHFSYFSVLVIKILNKMAAGTQNFSFQIIQVNVMKTFDERIMNFMIKSRTSIKITPSQSPPIRTHDGTILNDFSDEQFSIWIGSRVT